MALTAKQERFVAEYLIDLNPTQAAIRIPKERSAPGMPVGSTPEQDAATKSKASTKLCHEV